MITPAIWQRVLKYAKRGDTTSIAEILDEDLLALVASFDEAVKLLGAATCGGRFGPEESKRCSELFKLIGHEP